MRKKYNLGLSFDFKNCIFRVFAKSGIKLELLIYDDYLTMESSKYSMFEIEKYEEGSIYQCILEKNICNLKYYTYLVDTKMEVEDPYCKFVGVNSKRSYIYDVNDLDIKMADFCSIGLKDAILYELHLGDFTRKLNESDSAFSSFIDDKVFINDIECGLQHIKDLGITHIHLMPIFDFISIDETNRNNNNYNWGYDPILYNCVEGGYSSNPYDPIVRVSEMKKLVNIIHSNGLGVVMDVVFNHTYRSDNSILNILNPNYYYRLDKDLKFSNGSGCGNELDTEKEFTRDLIIESLLYWQKEFKIDGFRFDLMALIDKNTIDLAYDELKNKNIKTFFYGEPWMALSTTLDIDNQILWSSQNNGNYSLFNDKYRNCLKGDNDGYGIGFCQGSPYLKLGIELGLLGWINYDYFHMGDMESPIGSINYFNAHDNLILEDKFNLSMEFKDDIILATKLAFSLLFTSQGIPFIHAGNEFRRTKQMCANSYNASYDINAIDWSLKSKNIELYNYVKDIISLRKEYKIFRLDKKNEIKEKIHFVDSKNPHLIIVIYEISENEILVASHKNTHGTIEFSIDSYISKKFNGINSLKELKTIYNINNTVYKIFDNNGRCNKKSELLSTIWGTEIYKIKFTKGEDTMDFMKKYQSWLNNPYFDEKTISELKSIENDKDEIQDRFYQDLKFGTAGLRGKVGAGTNRMNVYTVAQATQGFAETIKSYGKEAMNKGIAISHDVRHMSDEFAKITAEVMAANGIKVYIYKDISPTPILSYTIRKLNTQAGVMVTASHNPKEYNGYKAYWKEGSQILDDIADDILSNIEKIDDYSKIPRLDFEEGLKSGIIEYINEDVTDSYINDVLSLTINDSDDLVDKHVNIVYSPLNGCGNKWVREILKRRGFDNIHIVSEQENPDPDFSTVGYPNPEDPKAFAYSIELGKKVDADILLATDPDSDRTALEVRDKNGEYVFLNGNKIGALLVNYILSQLHANNKLSHNGVIVKSIVTGDLTKAIAQKYGVEVMDVLTGFKNIAAPAHEWEHTGEKTFIFGFEESIGFNYGTFVRDKDAVSSAMMVAEMTGFYKKQGKSLLDVLDDIYKEYGYYYENLVSVVLEGLDGQALIGRIMEDMRNNPIKEIGQAKLDRTIDYEYDNTGLPKSNVLKYYYTDGSWFALRPSGTEPKIKLYMYSRGESSEESQHKLMLMEENCKSRMNAVK